MVNPVFVTPYTPDEYFSAIGAKVAWVDDTRTKAVCVWQHQVYNYATNEDSSMMKGCVVTVTSGVITAGPVTTWNQNTEVDSFNYASSDLGNLGDGYFVTGASWYSANFTDKTQYQTLDMIRVVGTTLEFVSSTVHLTNGGVNQTYVSEGPYFAQTQNPNRVLMTAGTTHDGQFSLWTVTRSGTTLTKTLVHTVTIPGGSKAQVWTDRAGAIGYFGGAEKTGTSGSIFTLDSSGNPNIATTTTYPDKLIGGFWARGPEDGQFVATWNGTTLGVSGFAVFDVVLVQVTAAGMTEIDRAGPYKGDAGWSSSVNRWIARTTMPDGTVVILPSVDSPSTARPFPVVDPFGTEPQIGTVLPTGGAYAPWDSNEYGWGMDMIGNSDGALLAMHAEGYIDDISNGAGSSMLALLFIAVPRGRGRLKINVGDSWKYAVPLPGENNGFGKLKVRTESGWKLA